MTGNAHLTSLTDVLGGAEIIVLPPILVPFDTPVDADVPLFPTLSVAAVDQHLVVGLLEGEESQPVLSVHDLHAWVGSEREIRFGSPPPTRAFAVGPSRTAGMFAGLALAATVTDGGVAGFGFTGTAAAGAATTTITASTPAHVTARQATTVGGLRTVDGASRESWVIAHERAGGDQILGAVSTADGFVQYRTTLLPWTEPDLLVTGSSSSLVLAQSPSLLSNLLIWDVATAPDHDGSTARVDRTLTLDTGADVGGIAAIELARAGEHWLAVPGFDGTSGSFVRVHELTCGVGSCTPSTDATVVTLPGDASPRQADMARVVSGVAVAATDSDANNVHLSLLDEARTLLATPALDAPWLVMPAPYRIAFIAIASTTTLEGTFLVVAALGRDFDGGNDLLVVTGLQACADE